MRLHNIAVYVVIWLVTAAETYLPHLFVYDVTSTVFLSASRLRTAAQMTAVLPVPGMPSTSA